MLARAGDVSGAPAAHRFFGAGGELLAMRADMTVPIARLVANRYATRRAAAALLLQRARVPRGPPAARARWASSSRPASSWSARARPTGTVEVIEVLSAALDAAGLGRAVIGLGDAALYRQLLDELGGRRRTTARAILDLLAAHDLVGLAAEIAGSTLTEPSASCSPPCPGFAAAPRCSTARASSAARHVDRAVGRLAETYEGIAERGIADRVSLDLGLLRDLGYYTGAILEIYDPALGHVLGGGGRYDELMGRFGRPLPAVGFALYLERVHIAQAEEERIAEEGPR